LDTIGIRNPRSGLVDARIAFCEPEAVAAIAARLRRGVAPWRARGIEGRLAVLQAWAEDVAGDDALLAALVTDTGRLGLSHGERAAAETLVSRWRRWAAAALMPMPSRSAETVAGVSVEGALVPYDLAGFITPWNSPLGLSLIDAIPALVAGCAALVKPSEVTPRFIPALQASIERHPELATVFAAIAGDGRTGGAVIDAVDLICFTGSVETGRKVAVRAAGRLIPAFLELGGKDAAIVLDGADVERAAAGIAWSAFMNTGQTCHSIERVYVARPLHDRFIAAMHAEAARVRLAWPGLEDGELGPFIAEPQAAKVMAQIDDALAKGGRIVLGGKPWSDGGWWMAPTVITNVDHDMALMREESFAPMIGLMAFDSTEDAIRLANDSDYGLSASVWGPEAAAHAVAGRLAAGGVSINDASLAAVAQEGEKMAFGCSGLGGTRMGPGAILRFVRRQALITSHGSARQPWWFQ